MGGVAYGAGKRALLEAAISVVASQGLRGLTYRSVAGAAGVTQGLVRHHFGDWDNLLEQALALALERSMERTGLESSSPGFEQFASDLVAYVTDDAELQAFQYEMALEARRRPEILPILERVYAGYREAVSRELARNGLDNPDLAWLVFAAVDGLVFQQTVFGRADQSERALRALRHTLRALSTGAEDS